MIADVAQLAREALGLAEAVIHQDAQTFAVHPARHIDAAALIERGLSDFLEKAAGHWF